MLAFVLLLSAVLGVLGAPAGPSEAVVSGPEGLRGTHRLGVVQANLDGMHRDDSVRSTTSAVRRAISRTGPDVVLLQEVCRRQFDRIVESRREWLLPGQAVHDHFVFFATSTRHGCAAGRPRLQTKGLVVASPHLLSRVRRTTLPDPAPGGPRRYGILCADVQVASSALMTYAPDAVRACSTHLRAGARRAEQAGGSRLAQTDAIRDLLRSPIVNDRTAVVLGGDFNSAPWRPPMSKLYRLTRTGKLNNRTGLFYEADQNGSYPQKPGGAHTGGRIRCRFEPDRCRWGQSTHWQPGQRPLKLDYVFFSMNRARPVPSRVDGSWKTYLSGQMRNNPTSTHDVYVARADLSLDLLN